MFLHRAGPRAAGGSETARGAVVKKRAIPCVVKKAAQKRKTKKHNKAKHPGKSLGFSDVVYTMCSIQQSWLYSSGCVVMHSALRGAWRYMTSHKAPLQRRHETQTAERAGAGTTRALINKRTCAREAQDLLVGVVDDRGDSNERECAFWSALASSLAMWVSEE